jgi:putative hydrolase of the HAD superfamily
MIENIIFDLGVVLLDVDYQKTIDAFGKIGLENPAEAFSKHKQDSFFKDFERGRVSSDEFFEELRSRIGVASDHDIKNAWNAMLGELPKEKFDLLRDLKLDYSLFILSNTNTIHKVWFENKIEEQHGWKEFEALFRFIGYSHKVGERKPDREAFEFLINRFNLNPAKTLFIDDTLEHVMGAQNCGIKTAHFTEGADLRALIREKT